MEDLAAELTLWLAPAALLLASAIWAIRKTDRWKKLVRAGCDVPGTALLQAVVAGNPGEWVELGIEERDTTSANEVQTRVVVQSAAVPLRLASGERVVLMPGRSLCVDVLGWPWVDGKPSIEGRDVEGVVGRSGSAGRGGRGWTVWRARAGTPVYVLCVLPSASGVAFRGSTETVAEPVPGYTYDYELLREIPGASRFRLVFARVVSAIAGACCIAGIVWGWTQTVPMAVMLVTYWIVTVVAMIHNLATPEAPPRGADRSVSRRPVGA